MTGPQFLLRFDDICPAMNWTVWRDVEAILVEAGVKPLLAVVPDNCDSTLNVHSPVADFWDRVRDWQCIGWSIGLHGFQHRYVTKAAGIIGRNKYSEFAGLSRSAQKHKLVRALEIFRRESVRPDAWVAPGHSFDDLTVDILAELGVKVISDGYSLFPYVCRRGVQWIPQQLGQFRSVPFGTWTVCLHINSWTAGNVAAFRNDLYQYRSTIVSLSELQEQYRDRPQGFSDYMFFSSFRALRAIRI